MDEGYNATNKLRIKEDEQLLKEAKEMVTNWRDSNFDCLDCGAMALTNSTAEEDLGREIK